MSDCFSSAYYLFFIGVISLLALYTATLVKVIRGSSFRFLIQVIVMMMISNLGTFISIIASTYWCTSGKTSSFWNVVLWLSRSIEDVFYYTAHWMIASKYNQIASEMPYLLHEVNIPASEQACHLRMFWILLVLNTLPAILESALGIPYNRLIWIQRP